MSLGEMGNYLSLRETGKGIMEHEQLCLNWQHFISSVEHPATPCICALVRREAVHN